MAPAPGNRSDGARASAWSTMRSSSGGTAVPLRDGAGAVSVNRLAMTAAAVGAANGGSPTSISYSTQPRL